jgi:hypothetical protein
MCSAGLFRVIKTRPKPDGLDLINALITYDQSYKACISSRITTVIQVERRSKKQRLL